MFSSLARVALKVLIALRVHVNSCVVSHNCRVLAAAALLRVELADFPSAAAQQVWLEQRGWLC
jgi:hypothetical protein